jgi:hypothetical protein
MPIMAGRRRTIAPSPIREDYMRKSMFTLAVVTAVGVFAAAAFAQQA